MAHGGVNCEDSELVRRALFKAVLAGSGGARVSCLSGVEEAIKVLEDDPMFNAGYGSVLNRLGEVEMDAAIMDGTGNRLGIVAGIAGVEHPISVARRLLEKGDAVFLAGTGALRFARESGFAPPSRDLRSPEQREVWEAIRANEGRYPPGVDPFTGFTMCRPGPSRPGKFPCDTVGCIVMDDQYRIACGTSTGGYAYKPPGRIGDSAVPGAGFWAGTWGAVVCSGKGEAFMELLLARRVEEWLKDGLSPQQAAEKAIEVLQAEKGVIGGVLVLHRDGRWGKASNAMTFPAAVARDGKVDFLSKVDKGWPPEASR